MKHGQVCSFQLLGSKTPDLFFSELEVKSLQSRRLPWEIACDLALLDVMTQAVRLLCTHVGWAGRDSKLQAAVRCLLMGRAAAVSEMSGPCTITGNQVLENWTCALYFSLFSWSHLLCMLRCGHLRHLICLFSHNGACWPSPTLIGVPQLVLRSHLLSSCPTSFFCSTLNGRGSKQDKEELSGC